MRPPSCPHGHGPTVARLNPGDERRHGSWFDCHGDGCTVAILIPAGAS